LKQREREEKIENKISEIKIGFQ